MAGERQADPAADDVEALAQARALTSPLRLRVLRLCRFEARTNKELADLLGVNPGTMLHHVRTLVRTGFLVPEAERAGAQGAREVPYRATGRSWQREMGEGGSFTLIETFLQQVEGVRDEDIRSAWLGLKLSPQSVDELTRRLWDILEDFKDRPADVDGEPLSLFLVLHPDLNPPVPISPDVKSAESSAPTAPSAPRSAP